VFFLFLSSLVNFTRSFLLQRRKEPKDASAELRKLKMPLASLKPFNAPSLDNVFAVFFGSPLKGFFTLRKCHFLNAFGANAR
jgi:hypothetical protein